MRELLIWIIFAVALLVGLVVIFVSLAEVDRDQIPERSKFGLSDLNQFRRAAEEARDPRARRAFARLAALYETRPLDLSSYQAPRRID